MGRTDDFDFSEKDLLGALRVGDRGAFTRIYDRFWGKLYAVAYNYTRSREAAQEVVQEVFVGLWLKRERLEIRQSLEKYLYAAVKFQIYDALDKQRSAQRYAEFAAHALPVGEETTAQHVAFAETSELLETQVAAFPETTRRVFVLSRVEGWPVARIAHTLELSPKAVEYHLTKAIKLLRLRLATWLWVALLLNVGNCLPGNP
jgi:RNA polymerase sigma-70 factor (ECF subfamily)